MAAGVAASFFMIWLTPPDTFTPRFMRSVESVFRHHPHARLDVLSNTLPLTYFTPISTLGFEVRVTRYDLRTLVAGGRAQVWYDFRRFWNRSSYFANHEADLLRLLWLNEHGGVYLDTDVVFVRPLRMGADAACAHGVIGIESGAGGLSAEAAFANATAEAELSAHPPPSTGALSALRPRLGRGEVVLCNAVLGFERAAPFVRLAIDSFVSDYVPLTPGLGMLELYARGEWGAMGPLLLTRLIAAFPTKARGEAQAGADARQQARKSAAPCVVERDVFYPISPAEAVEAFGSWDEGRDLPRWDAVQRRSVAVHYWNALTRDAAIRCGSLVHRLLEQGCVRCDEPLACT